MHHETKPEDRIPLSGKAAYGMGAIANNLLSAAIGNMTIVLNLGLGMSPALVGLLGALPRLTDAVTDPVMGYVSDRTRSRWGRRRPYIFCGVMLAALVLVFLWQLPEGRSESYYFWYFLAGSFLFYLAYTVFATPWVALGYELTPDYHERTRLMGVQSFMGQFAWIIAPWFLWFMDSGWMDVLSERSADWFQWFQDNGLYFDSLQEGAGGLAILIAIAVVCLGVMPALLLRERGYAVAASSDERQAAGPSGLRRFLRDFAATVRFKPFLYLCGATFLVFNGFMMISSFQTYVIIYYLYAGDTGAGAELAGLVGTVGAVSTFFVIWVVTQLSNRVGKRRAFFTAIGISVVGYLLKWFCYDPEQPWLLLLAAPLMAFGLGGLFTLMGAMIADVCDLDELESGERREGMFGSIYWWVVKLGMAAAIAVGGFLLEATGFDVALEGAQAESTLLYLRLLDVVVPAATSLIAIYLVSLYPIGEDRAYEVRTELEARRGPSEALAAV